MTEPVSVTSSELDQMLLGVRGAIQRRKYLLPPSQYDAIFSDLEVLRDYNPHGIRSVQPNAQQMANPYITIVYLFNLNKGIMSEVVDFQGVLLLMDHKKRWI